MKRRAPILFGALLWTGLAGPAGAVLTEQFGPAAETVAAVQRADEAALADRRKAEVGGYVALRLREEPQRSGGMVRSTALVNSTLIKLRAGTMRYGLKIRPVLENSGARLKVQTDEAYAELAATPTTFISLGRRQSAHGVGVGNNPTDFMNRSKAQDRTLLDEERRSERIGDDAAGFVHYAASFSVSALVARAAESEQRHRVLIQISQKIDALNTDLSVLAFQSDRPAVGLNLSTVVSDAATAYLEYALTRGRDRGSFENAGTLPQRLVVQSDAGAWLSDYVIGTQYTSDAGVNATLEYWANSHGYTDRELGALLAAPVLQPELRAAQRAMLSSPSLRRRKVFLRVTDIRPAPQINLEATLIYALDDQSKFLRAAVNVETAKLDAIRIGVDRFIGDAVSEYGRNPARTRVFLSYKSLF